MAWMHEHYSASRQHIYTVGAGAGYLGLPWVYFGGKVPPTHHKGYRLGGKFKRIDPLTGGSYRFWLASARRESCMAYGRGFYSRY